MRIENQDNDAADTIMPLEFSQGDDPSNWLTFYEMTTQFNKWNTKHKLLYLPHCFSGEARSWSINAVVESNGSWSTFKKAFLLKFVKKREILDIAKEAHAIKMKEGESYVDYMERFEAIRRKYRNEQQRAASVTSQHPALNGNSKEQNEAEEGGQPPAALELKDQEDTTIPESVFVRSFIHGLYPRELAVTMWGKNLQTMEQAYEVTSDFQAFMNLCHCEESEPEPATPSESSSSDSNKNEPQPTESTSELTQSVSNLSDTLALMKITIENNTKLIEGLKNRSNSSLGFSPGVDEKSKATTQNHTKNPPPSFFKPFPSLERRSTDQNLATKNIFSSSTPIRRLAK